MTATERLLISYPRNILAIKDRKDYLSAPRGKLPGDVNRAPVWRCSSPVESAVLRWESDPEIQRLESVTEPITAYLKKATPLEYAIIDHRYWQGEDWATISDRLKLTMGYCRDDLRKKILKKVEYFFSKTLDK